MNLREINIAKRRQAILDAAREIVATQGAEALSMRALAKKAGFAVSTLYNLFGTRDEILFALINDGLASIRPLLQEQIPSDPFAVLLNLPVAPVQRLIENKWLFLPIIAAGYHNVQTRSDPRNLAIYGGLIDLTAELIKSAQKQGRLVDEIHPRILAAEVFYTYRNAIEDWACGEIDDDALSHRAECGVLLLLLAAVADRFRPQLLERLKKLQSPTANDLQNRFPSLGKRRDSQ